MTLTQPLKWHGGKHYLAKWIVSHFPKHLHYVEPYFGGGSVLFEKTYTGVSEVVNDINGALINFWKVLRDPKCFEAMKQNLIMTPFASPMFVESLRKVADFIGGDKLSISAAVDFFIAARQSRQGLMKDFATLSRNRVRRGMNEQVSSWLTAIDGLPEVHQRLRRVVILNSPALEVIKQQDGPNTLFYLDPPYLHSTRVTTSDYTHEMSIKDHQALLYALAHIEGKFVLSGYPSTLYDSFAKSVPWFVDTKEIDNKASSASEKELKTECLWMNFDWTKR